jgi:hypothetical protein
MVPTLRDEVGLPLRDFATLASWREIYTCVATGFHAVVVEGKVIVEIKSVRPSHLCTRSNSSAI